MTDYSEEPLGAPGGRRREPEEKMRVFLDCEKAAYGRGYDFSKGGVKFEYKHSMLRERNKRSTERHRRSGPTTTWRFGNLRGHGGKKSYDYLILEGEAEGDSYLFLISFKELSHLFPALNEISVTLRMRGPMGRPPWGRISKFVWEHEITREKLKTRVDQYARASEETDCPGRELLEKSVKSAENEKKNSPSTPNCLEGFGNVGHKPSLQLPLPFEE